MKQVIINVPDNKYVFFAELLQSIDNYNEAECDIREKEKKLIPALTCTYFPEYKLGDKKPH